MRKFLIATLVAAILPATALADEAANIAAVRGMIETINQRDLDGLSEYVADDVVRHSTATPGVITLNNDAGVVPAANILGTQNVTANAIMVLSYVIHREAGDVYHEVYSWST